MFSSDIRGLGREALSSPENPWEAKLSLKNNKMYVSPWRSLSYMRCKWLYPLGRSKNQTRVTNQGPVGNVQRGAHTRSTGNWTVQLDVLKMYCSSSLSR
ncbi:hypothetical protein KP509_01G086600 [Ceratopteris richardii]|uniref:Uncharacterized protein n=1 Tax=Ceratopteris richardii TaxID=49495 RepID=A0A8T2VMP0_CERRI|nr:hypothetical protein KP509_01G086600 [Ceratopteris richardii]